MPAFTAALSRVIKRFRRDANADEGDVTLSSLGKALDGETSCEGVTVVAGMLLEWTSSGLKERWVSVDGENLTVAYDPQTPPFHTIPLQCVEAAAILDPREKPLSTGQLKAVDSAMKLLRPLAAGGHAGEQGNYAELDLENGFFEVVLFGHGEDGHLFLAPGPDLRDWWLEGLHNAIASNQHAREAQAKHPQFERARGKARMLYHSSNFQVSSPAWLLSSSCVYVCMLVHISMLVLVSSHVCVLVHITFQISVAAVIFLCVCVHVGTHLHVGTRLPTTLVRRRVPYICIIIYICIYLYM